MLIQAGITVPLPPEAIALAQREHFVADLIPTLPAPAGNYAYLKQSTRTNSAARVADGATKPTSVYTLTRVDDVVTTGADALVRTRTALATIQQSNLQPTAYAFTPSDWAKVETVALAQFAANQGVGNPVGGVRQTLWDVPVMVTTSLTHGTAILGDFAGSSTVYNTGDVRLDWSENTYDSVAAASDFERNHIRFRAEGRFGFAVPRPAGFVSITIA